MSVLYIEIIKNDTRIPLFGIKRAFCKVFLNSTIEFDDLGNFDF